MMKMRKSPLLAFLVVAATSLSGCFGSKTDGGSDGDGSKEEVKSIAFWDSFGSKYSTKLGNIIHDMQADTKLNLGFSIEHTSKGSYPGVLKAVSDSIANSMYPGVAIGYPDHFAVYQSRGILQPLSDVFSASELADFDQDYMPENYLYEKGGKQELYGVPFNKSTELLGYNGVFVDYCAEKYSDPELKKVPATWAEWADVASPTSKVFRYREAFEDLKERKVKLYAVQDADGTAHDFSETAADGKILVLDYSELKAETKTMLFTWDATDNAFITMVRQFGGKYTEVAEEERKESPTRRIGDVLFANEANIDTTVNMLKYLNNMNKNRIFGSPGSLDGQAKFASEAFAKGHVMFMICSSGGLSYNTKNWARRFRLAPIPYTDASHKYVISQGANLCIFKGTDKAKAAQFVKALTTGEYQTRWAIETGYFPAANSSLNSSAYTSFINGTSYEDETLVTYREGAAVNKNEYKAKGWTKFVDEPFVGSATVRSQVGKLFDLVFSQIDADHVNDADSYKALIKNQMTQAEITSNKQIHVDFWDIPND
jgi:multiple sugar transport system substrate-binding protein